MKNNSANGLIAQLNRLRSELDTMSQPESRAAFLRALDALIHGLGHIRAQLSSPALATRASEIQTPLTQLIEFLERAKEDEDLAPFLLDALEVKSARPKRQPVEIPPALTNDEIRGLLDQDLSRAELKTLAAQRGISAGKATIDEIKKRIIRSLERQEGYQRLALA